MERNIFLGGGFFGSRQLPVVGPALGRMKYGRPSNQVTRPESALVARRQLTPFTKPPMSGRIPVENPELLG